MLRLVLSAVLGGLVGLERERLEWAAGMRTHALVSLGSALFMVVSIFGFSDILAEQHVILDPSRVAAQVASGIGFIGAGTIILRREVVKGLTTAASIWAVAAVGLAVGGGMFLAAGAATLLALALLVLAKPLKARLFPNRKEARRVRVVVGRGTPLAELRDEIEASEGPLDDLQVDLPDATFDVHAEVDVRFAVGVVDVGVAHLLEPLSVDLAQAAFGLCLDPNPAWQQHSRLTYPALYAGVEALRIVAREINRGLASPHL